MAFDTYKTMLQDEAGKISGPRTVIAGFGAGITESLLAVTPFESIKTTLCVCLSLSPSLLPNFSPSYRCLSVPLSLLDLLGFCSALPSFPSLFFPCLLLISRSYYPELGVLKIRRLPPNDRVHMNQNRRPQIGQSSNARLP